MTLRLRDYFYRPSDYLLALVVVVLVLLVVLIVIMAVLFAQMSFES